MTHILCLEDDPVISLLIKAKLTKSGYTAAIGNRFSVTTAPRKIHRTNQLGAGASSCAHFPIVHESVQTVLD